MQLSPRVWLYEQGCAPPPAALRTPGALALAQIPSGAFGDGSHPTTRLCAGAVDLLCRQLTRDHDISVLDVGTGTGVLARIAQARGAQKIAATDIDPQALEAARRNFALDSCVLDRGANTIDLDSCLPDHWGPVFDLVVANILEQPLRELAPRLTAALAPGGALLLSGFTPLQFPGLRLCFERQGLRWESESTLEGWSLTMLRATHLKK